ncbi:Dihydrofolate reductase [Pediococcus damnosus]|uniref:Dihydrofolate reductase n=1 Tax=Pediococcus damnosus TaxID=51663 RepID=A0A0R2HU47_9LACO|nr:dihydrofolate reductase [Pediococcus damnosus]AMV61546.1 Dihydrofolate reductase [Pediococcus damnosus]AMV62089.1 Dihydrofolate reductase [Pediococcus damnosus]AMV65909.1 Dihydrofolate reductase [Pediococcus damnosus]AMV68060.1 Dihydrofolate reductase [Pediococcus damnosus]AMV70244.1 Dihydrofolate reductase [Pediococcus damnosus]
MLAFIWAESKNGVIGSHNQLPWHIPDDTSYFKQLTTNHPVVMGRKTFESFGAKPLPNRLNIVLTRQTSLKETDNLKVYHSVEKFLADFSSDSRLIFIIGGKEIYRQLYPYAEKLYRTRIDDCFAGDTKMIAIDYSKWRLVETLTGSGPKKKPIPHRFEVYERKNTARVSND